MFHKNKSSLTILSICVIFLLSSCASTHKASGFLSDYSNLGEGKYFKQMYVNPDADLSAYKKVKVRPVITAYLEKKKIKEEELTELTEYFKTVLETKFGDKYKILSPTEGPDSETLVIETALTKIGSPNRVLNALLIIVTWWPGVHGGHAAFEARVTEGVSGKLLAQIAEKRSYGSAESAGDAVKSQTVDYYTKYGHVRAIFTLWAEHLKEMLQS